MFLKRMMALLLCMLCLVNGQAALGEAAVAPAAMVGTSLTVLIDTEGSTVSGCAVSSVPDGYTETTFVYIQKYVDGEWKLAGSNAGRTMVETSATMQHGYTYRIYGICRVWGPGGGQVDFLNAYSGTVTY